MTRGSLSNRSGTSTVIFGDLRKQDGDSSGERKRHVPCTSWAVPPSFAVGFERGLSL